ncbi:class 1 fructose-bisphosphatase [Pseudonocardia endophytica]|uniref:Fructose-1,6-bisphosphatase class 1 n=1 Tax=Pseudonocardia endophytica TaxID=401976 RepID=A0A4R1HWV5_PSEEN|nr:class 1 fructose-bisphosphatase [Pseudonocardia endophytica]TCK27217.1 D-fructose 1,6-bisphosphatase [Pseudonocardia endophytica]
MHAAQPSLETFLAGRCRGRTAPLVRLVPEIARVCATIAAHLATGPLTGLATPTAQTNTHGEVQKGLDLLAHECFVRADWEGRLAGLVSEEAERPHMFTSGADARHLLMVDPLDGSSNVEVDGPLGTIFSILPAPPDGLTGDDADFLRPGTEQLCAGYVLYGPSTQLVLTVGDGVHAFTLDPGTGTFHLTGTGLRVPEDAPEFSVNTANRRFWEPAVRRWVDECHAGRSGPLHRDFTMRWTAALVADSHRILTRGGVYLNPWDGRNPDRPAKLRLLYEAAPMAFLFEQAGGAATTGRGRILDVEPRDVHQRVPLVIGSRHDVLRIEQYHQRHNDGPSRFHLYGERGLFRQAAV